ncbi:MAG: tRNA (adenosine(37)-N6)-dimethylallyltransferase MiaA [bacterium]|nr:tRNA (adenosine(37)-N6)-dimethylallyltransferase MiaA [bacterium]
MTGSPDTRPVVPVLLGPTGAGKTALLDTLIDSSDGVELPLPPIEIISCDSRQIYRELEIGSAAPDAELRARLPHHLVGILEPTATYSAAQFRTDALAAIDDVLQRGRLPIVAGGSGFYFRALHTGLFEVDVDADRRTEIREQVIALGPAERLRRLRELDPGAVLAEAGRQASAGCVHPNDDYRISRALEICLGSGRRYSEIWAETRERGLSGDAGAAGPYRFAGWRLEVEREEYWRNLAERAGEMVSFGIAAEAGRVFERYGMCAGLETLGYADALAAWRGEIDGAELAERLFIAHRQYGKRQRTWLRGENALSACDPVSLKGDFRRRLAACLSTSDAKLRRLFY